MPRPDSKIMSMPSAQKAQAIIDNPSAVAASMRGSEKAKVVARAKELNGNAVKLSAVTTPPADAPVVSKSEAKRLAAQAPAPSKAEIKQKKADLAAVLKTAREPLDKIEGDIAALVKTGLAAEKAHEKVLNARERAVKAHDKALASLVAKKDKYAAAFAKSQAKHDSAVAKLG